MDQQNQAVDNDLQKAIDDITNTTDTDPVFSDPVAAPSSVPEGDTGELSAPVGPFPDETKVDILPPAPEPMAPLEATNIPELNELPSLEPEPTPKEPTPAKSESTEERLDTKQVKDAALRDLMPLMDKVDLEPQQKFNIYRDAFEDLHDHTILEPTYKAAREISDEKERAKALLYLVESIDKM
ncbi:hypothetical protein IKF03_03535 [Candidatus Saccharibacteria bacterium]|nr:hypothetical protein [Candidatus Saccharibacteria bacterium]